MAREPFGAEDLATLNLVLRQFPRVADLAALVRRISQGATYPITSFDALAAALGGDEAMVRVGRRELPLAEVRRLIPAYYFPIAAEDDLAAKLIELLGRRPGPWNWAPPGGMPMHRHRHHHHRGHGGWGPRPYQEEMQPPWRGGGQPWRVAGPPPWAAGGPPPWATWGPGWGGPPPPPPMMGGHQADPSGQPMPPPPDRPE